MRLRGVSSNQIIKTMEKEIKQMLAKIEKARAEFKPDKINYLLVAEAPPDSVERFFYFPNVRDKDFLFLGVMDLLFPEIKSKYLQSGRDPAIKTILLNKFKTKGFYLLDLSDLPTKYLTIPLEECLSGLIKRIEAVVDKKKTKIILIKANVFETAYYKLKSLGYDVIDQKIPFPSSGQQGNFKIQFTEVLRVIKFK